MWFLKKSHKKNITKSKAIFLIAFGLTLYFFPLFFRVINNFIYQLHIRVNQETKAAEMKGPIYISSEFIHYNIVVSNYPTRLIIPSIYLDLRVKPARIINGVWETDNDSVNYGLGSALPGIVGNSVFFAHARAGLFLPLININQNDPISVQTKDGQWVTYFVVEKKEVRPDKIEVIGPTPDKTLTLFTCSGFAESKRLIIIAKQSNSVVEY